MHKIMVVNLGGTSTKVALYDDETCACETSIRHTDEELSACTDNAGQIEMRKKAIIAWAKVNSVDLGQLNAIVFRMVKTNGLCKTGGTYRIEGILKDTLLDIYKDNCPKAAHPGIITYPLLQAILDGRDIPIYAVDPDDLDEFSDVAHFSGHPDYPRTCGIHMINQKAMARKASAELGKKYSETKLVVAHLGGGNSIASHDHGRIVDSTHAGVGEGPFATTRSGALPILDLAQSICSGKLDLRGVMDILLSKGGFIAHTGFSDLRLIEQKAAEGDTNCDLAIRAFIYQVCKYIGAQFAALGCEADAIVLTGGVAYSKRVTEAISACVGKLAPVLVYPGENEIEAMAVGTLSVLRGEENVIPVNA